MSQNKNEAMLLSQNCNKRGLYCKKYMDHALGQTHFCMYGSKVIFTSAHVKVLKEGENQHRAVAFFFY